MRRQTEEDKNVVWTLLVLAVALMLLVIWVRYERFQECRSHGHTTMYCLGG